MPKRAITVLNGDFCNSSSKVFFCPTPSNSDNKLFNILILDLY